MSEELKPCPFCGGPAQPFERLMDDGRMLFFGLCRLCHAEGPCCDLSNFENCRDLTQEESMEAWNTRAEEK